MAKHSLAYSSVLPIIIRDEKVLLHLRQNTGYMDGYWDLAGSGHIDEGELATEALVRECYEELGIVVKQENLRFAFCFQNVGLEENPTYFHLYFWIDDFLGEPSIMEKEKNAALEWFSIENLPKNMIPLRKEVLELALKNQSYGQQKA